MAKDMFREKSLTKTLGVYYVYCILIPLKIKIKMLVVRVTYVTPRFDKFFRVKDYEIYRDE